MCHSSIKSLFRAACVFALLFFAQAAISAPGGNGGLLQTGLIIEGTNSDQGFYQRIATTNVYDKHGTLTALLETNYFSGFGYIQNSLSSTIYSYDNEGNLVLSVEDDDYNADGTVDSRVTIIYTNLPNGQMQEIALYDGDLDGKADQILTSTWTFMDYRPVRFVLDFDLNADGVVDSRSTQTWTYDLAHDRIYSITTYEPNADGVVDDSSTITTTIVTDDHGLTLSEVAQFANGDPVTSSFIYDKSGDLEQIVSDSNGGHSTETWIYAHRGQVIRSAPHPNSRDVFGATRGSLANRFRR